MMAAGQPAKIELSCSNQVELDLLREAAAEAGALWYLVRSLLTTTCKACTEPSWLPGLDSICSHFLFV